MVFEDGVPLYGLISTDLPPLRSESLRLRFELQSFDGDEIRPFDLHAVLQTLASRRPCAYVVRPRVPLAARQCWSLMPPYQPQRRTRKSILLGS